MSDNWESLSLELPDKRPRITPGAYQAQAVTLQKKRAYGRDTLEMGFAVWRGDPCRVGGDFMQDKAAQAEHLANIPLFMPWPKPRKGSKDPAPSPNSQIARLFYLTGRSRQQSLNVKLLCGAWFYVEVGDQEQDSQKRKLSPEEVYSVIKRVVRHLQ